MQLSIRIFSALVVPAALAACQILVGCQVYPYRAEVVEKHSTLLDDIELVRLASTNGALVVRGEDRDDLFAEITKFARGKSESDALDAAEAVEIELLTEDNGRTMALVARVPKHLRDRSAGASFVVRLPRHVDIRANTSNGEIDVAEIAADVVAKTSNGKAAARQIVGNVDLRTSNGSIDLDDVDALVITVSTSNGRIHGAQCRGDIRAETSNGSIDLEMVRLSERPEVYAKTSNGSVKLALPATVSADVELSTSNGGIDTDLAGAGVAHLSKGKRDLQAQLNGGGGSVEVKTSNGRIRFSTDR